jgi:FMN-dependent oxidoreductase (nitrilotriacetate monooxygenase family)
LRPHVGKRTKFVERSEAYGTQFLDKNDRHYSVAATLCPSKEFGFLVSKLLHLFAFMTYGVNHHAHLMWADPRDKVNYDFSKPAFWQDLARTLERGYFDGLFLADFPGGPVDVYQGSPDAAIRRAVQFPRHDPAPLSVVVAAATKHLGFGLTLSTAFDHPMIAARRLATLDHLTGGRLSWNVVTSFNPQRLKAFGLDSVRAHDDRYRHAAEFVEICKQAWDSWDEDAIVADREAGIYADPTKVHPVKYSGDFFEIDAYFPVTRSPQGSPVIFQAGSSEQGREFAAKHAEAIFALAVTTADMKTFTSDMRRRFEAHGRDPQSAKIVFQAQVVLGASRQEAEDKVGRWKARIPPESPLAFLSGSFGQDLSLIDLDQDLRADGLIKKRALLETLAAEIPDRTPTLRELVELHKVNPGAPLILGTPEDVADAFEDFAVNGDADGFNMLATYTPGCYAEFVDLVVPILQRRGLMRRRYAGETLRENLLQTNPF